MNPLLYQAMVLRQALRLYAKGIRVGREWTPGRMFKVAGQITGRTYKRGAYLAAADDLTRWIQENQ